jgi:hypothetical protein
VPQRFVARTERPALGGSAAGECLRKPGKHHRPPQQLL